MTEFRRDQLDALAEHRGMVFRFLLVLTRNVEVSDEIAQETFRVAVSKPPDPARVAEHGAWLRAVAKNCLRNYQRRRAAKWLVYDSHLLDLAEGRFLAAGGDRDELWETRRRALRACMEGLEPPDRAVLERRYERGEQVQAIAGGMGLEPNNLSKRLERLRTALRKCVESKLRAGDRG